MSRLEHANMTVPDMDAAVRFLQLIAPDFMIRHDAVSDRGYRWVHIGNNDSYIALQEIHSGFAGKFPPEAYVNYGVNHLCMIIDDAIAVEQRLLSAGYRRKGPTLFDSHRKRLYFYDDSGLEWELVEYTSDDPAERYLYE